MPFDEMVIISALVSEFVVIFGGHVNVSVSAKNNVIRKKKKKFVEEK